MFLKVLKIGCAFFMIFISLTVLAVEIIPKDEVVYSFAVMGCNRLGGAAIDRQNNPSTANLAQLQRTLSDLTQLEKLDPDADLKGLNAIPKYFFFTGDLVYGHTDDDALLISELAAWKPIWENSPAAKQGTKLVPIPGNHEFLVSRKGSYTQIPAIYAKPDSHVEQDWLKQMAPYIKANNGPNPTDVGNPDNLLSDQNQLTYSFDDEKSHFVVMNTDYACKKDGGDEQCGVANVPLNWLTGDIKAAAKHPATKHIFVFGHKPAFPIKGYVSYPQDSMALHLNQRENFWNLLNETNSVAYLTSHVHAYHKGQPSTGIKPKVSKTWQIVAGNAGSQFSDAFTTDPKHIKNNYFGFTVIKVYQSGRVRAVSYGRGYGPDYNGPSDAKIYPTAAREAYDLVSGR